LSKFEGQGQVEQGCVRIGGKLRLASVANIILFIGGPHRWKEVAKQRIQSYRKTTEALTLEKEKIEKEKAIESENLN
jgi:hypothetical protein